MKEYMVMRVSVGSFSISFVFEKALNHFFLFLKMDRFQKAHIEKYFFCIEFVIVGLDDFLV